MIELVSNLRPHPLNEQIYGHEELDADFLESCREAVTTPLIITFDNVVISGHRRLAAARHWGHATVPVVVTTLTEDAEIARLLIELNLQREKTQEQKAREAAHMLKLRVDRYGSRELHVNAVADTMQSSPSTVRRQAAAIDAIDSARESGDNERAESLTQILNEQGPQKAIEAARSTDRPAEPEIDIPTEDDAIADVLSKTGEFRSLMRSLDAVMEEVQRHVDKDELQWYFMTTKGRLSSLRQHVDAAKAIIWQSTPKDRCKRCGGTGELATIPCADCEGMGWLPMAKFGK